MDWQPIETAPRDWRRQILLYWPSYAYSPDEEACEVIAIGWWKENGRLRLYTDDKCQHPIHNFEQAKAELEQHDIPSQFYFSDNSESDDYGLAQRKHWPTHWMPLPHPPNTSRSTDRAT